MYVKQIGMNLENHKYTGPFVSYYQNRIIGRVTDDILCQLKFTLPEKLFLWFQDKQKLINT